MPLLSTLLLAEAVDKDGDWDESKHPRAEGGRFGSGGGGAKEPPESRRGAGFDTPGASRLRWTPAGADPKALAAVAVQRARFAGEGSKTLAAEAARAAIRAGAGKEEKIRAAAVARAAVRREVGGAHMKRPEQAAMLQQRFGAGRERKGPGAGVAPKPPVAPVNPAPKPPVVDLKVQGEHAAIENHLNTSQVAEIKQIGVRGITNASDSYRVTFANGEQGMWKPASGAATEQYRPNIKPGQDAEREASAWEVAKIVGMHDLVPATTIRNDVRGMGRGSMQNFVKDSLIARKALQPGFDGSRDFSRAAVFDFIIGHEDRHAENWMVGNTSGKLGLIDNGLAFPEHTQLTSIRGFLAAADGHDYYGIRPPKTEGTPADWAKPYVQHKDAILSKLTEMGLPPKSIQGVSARIDMIKDWDSPANWHHVSLGGSVGGGGGVGGGGAVPPAWAAGRPAPAVGRPAQHDPLMAEIARLLRGAGGGRRGGGGRGMRALRRIAQTPRHLA